MVIVILLKIAVFYIALGLLFAIPFITKGVSTIDDGAKGSSIGFRIIIIPGVIVFWPLLLRKWIKVKPVNHDKTA